MLTAARVAGPFAFTAVFDTGTEETRAVTDAAFDVAITP